MSKNMNKLACKYLSASPIACVPVAQAETIPKFGPCAPTSIAIMAPCRKKTIIHGDCLTTGPQSALIVVRASDPTGSQQNRSPHRRD